MRWWRTNNIEHVQASAPKYYAYGREYMRSWRLQNKVKLFRVTGTKCSRCSFDNPKALQFHHKDPTQKKFGVLGKLSRVATVNWDEIWEEVDKCELICANCHQIERNNMCDVDVLRDLISCSD